MSAFDAENFLKTLTGQSGIYQMYDAGGSILYVGKAKNLKNRVGSYFRNKGLNNKTLALVAKIHQIEITVTATETEALILEHNLIKKQKPPYNILLRDDKSYPYIVLSSNEYPRIAKHRGAHKKQGQYFGPFPSVVAVNESLNLLQKVFRLRDCEDSVFKNRSRPCLQYQINRCSGPCVKLISEQRYAEDVHNAKLFLQGKSDQLIKNLAQDMDRAATLLEFERAAELRDQVAALRRIQSQQGIDVGRGDIDIIGHSEQGELACVHVLFVRRGRMLGSKSFFPKLSLNQSGEEVLESFLMQFYLADHHRDMPKEIIVPKLPQSVAALREAFSLKADRQVSIQASVRSQRAQWRVMAETTAEQNLKARIGSRQNIHKRFEALQKHLQLKAVPNRLECFDISHSSGEKTVASCVVFDLNGPLKSDYRRFNIEGITAGDDYAAMEQALRRRYRRLLNNEALKVEDGKCLAAGLPDILFVDGGKGQLSRARAVFTELGVTGVILVGVAKGSTRKAGFETLYIESSERELSLDSHDPALHLIQHIRDESHRFAITGHKMRRDKARRTSKLEGIVGVGAKRRRELLRHFGGMQALESASEVELAKVAGISGKLASDIFASLHV